MLAIQPRKLTITQRISEIENKIDNDHNKYITTEEFNKLTEERFTARLAQSSLTS